MRNMLQQCPGCRVHARGIILGMSRYIYGAYGVALSATVIIALATTSAASINTDVPTSAGAHLNKQPRLLLHDPQPCIMALHRQSSRSDLDRGRTRERDRERYASFLRSWLVKRISGDNLRYHNYDIVSVGSGEKEKNRERERDTRSNYSLI